MLTEVEVAAIGSSTTFGLPTVTTDRLRLPIEEPEDYSELPLYIVQNIEGLDPISASLGTKSLPLSDLSILTSASIGPRNVVLTLGINEDYADNTVESLRNNLYRFFMPRNEIQMVFKNDSYIDRYITGTVESLEFPIFTEAPQAQISVLCPNSNFSSVENFSETIPTSALSEWVEIDYSGTAPTGVSLNITTISSFPGFTLEIKPEGGATQSFIFKETLPRDTMVELRTFDNGKVIRTKPYLESSWTSKIGYVDRSSQWPKLSPGKNFVRVYSLALTTDCHLEYPMLFGGL